MSNIHFELFKFMNEHGDKTQDVRESVMPDREKVIKALECCQMVYECKPYEKCPYSNGYECGDCDINQLHYDALALLKEQEAVKPIAKEDDTFECVCGAIVGCEELDSSGIVTNRFNYCPFCGQAVKWE